MHRRVVQLAILTAVMTTYAEDSPPPFQSVLIHGVPHVKQKPDFCGEASAEMFLRAVGENMDQDYVFDRSGVDPSMARGVYAAELAHSLSNIGINVGQVWNPIDSNDELHEQFSLMHEDLLNGIPSIVCMHFSEENDNEHFRLVLGYDAQDDSVIYHEPAEENGAYRKIQRDDFLELWALQGRYQWGTIRLRMDPGEIEYGDASEKPTNADYAQHVLKLRENIPEGFTIVIEEPFVVIGDALPAEVKSHAERTVRWAVELLKKDYFAKNPEEIIDIWLFKDNASYRFHTASMFGHDPETPYGYYSSDYNALIMNISTGGGTLVHEIVHPFINANFPTCPSWFNEGLASLYEYPSTRDGHIHGLVNWRLPSLKKAVADGSLPSFQWLTRQTELEFYGKDPGTNYAQARYLCYYLQQKGLLVDFYHAFYENRRWDRTGYKTLKEVLGITSWSSFQREWENWVESLPE